MPCPCLTKATTAAWEPAVQLGQQNMFAVPFASRQVRAELAPWEKKIGEVSGRISVAATERDALARRAEDAKRRLDAALKVGPH